jgi:hypothetical protein
MVWRPLLIAVFFSAMGACASDQKGSNDAGEDGSDAQKDGDMDDGSGGDEVDGGGDAADGIPAGALRVEMGGQDSGDCRVHPCRTMDYAGRQMNPGDLLLVGD